MRKRGASKTPKQRKAEYAAKVAIANAQEREDGYLNQMQIIDEVFGDIEFDTRATPRGTHKGTKGSVGRQSTYTPEIGEKICECVARGVGMYMMAGKHGLPREMQLWRWMDRHADFKKEYLAAKIQFAHRAACEIIHIADKPSDPKSKFSADDKRIRIDARKWAAGKLAPRIYGDKMQFEDLTERGVDADALDAKLARAIAAHSATSSAGEPDTTGD